MKKFLWYFTFFVLVLAVYAPVVYQLILFVIAWLSAIFALRLWR